MAKACYERLGFRVRHRLHPSNIHPFDPERARAPNQAASLSLSVSCFNQPSTEPPSLQLRPPAPHRETSMGECKMLNKYYPHDFNPSKIPRRRRPANGQIKVRAMLPMTLRCAACGAYLGRGTKFNARKEDAAGERYLGAIKVFRFYIRCPRCAAEIAFKTDPASSDYAVESGARRCRDADDHHRMEAGGDDSMGALEDRARDGRREMDADAALEEARSLRSRQARVTPAQLLESLNRRRDADAAALDQKTLQEVEQDDEALIRSVTFGATTGHIKRIEEEDEEDFFEACLAKTMASHQARRKKQGRGADRSMVVVSKKRRCVPMAAEGKAWSDVADTDASEAKTSAGKTKASNGALQVLCCSYDDGSDGDES